MNRLPNHWSETRLKWSCKLTAGGTPPTDDASFWIDGEEGCGVPFISISDMSRRERVDSTARALTPAGLASRKMPVAGPDTLLLAMYASVGEVSRIGIPEATWNQALLGITPSPAIDIRFLHYSLSSRRDEFLAEVRSNTQSNLNAKQVANLALPLPPLVEQRAIADYLDRETAQLDTLIEEQRRLSTLLCERRDALWSDLLASAQAPTVPIRRVIESIVDGPFGSSLTSAHYTDSGTRVIRLGNIGVFEFKGDDAAYIDDEYGRRLDAHSARPGDVVIAGLGDDRMPLGRAALVPDHLGPAIVKADCYRVRPNRSLVRPEYLAWAMSAPPSRAQIGLLARGSTRARLNTSVVREVTIPLPTLAAQKEAVAEFGFQAARIDRSIVENERFVELATERRTALITAAVTGQIDLGATA